MQNLLLLCPQVSIVLDKDNAPRTTALVLLAGQIGRCTGCRFYRNEAAPEVIMMPKYKSIQHLLWSLVPHPWNAKQVGSFGPPYGLLQGSLDRLPAVPPLEGSRNITCVLQAVKRLLQMASALQEGGFLTRQVCYRRGSVCMIAGTKEFFIAVVDHAEWSGSFTVWGQVCAFEFATLQNWLGTWKGSLHQLSDPQLHAHFSCTNGFGLPLVDLLK